MKSDESPKQCIKKGEGQLLYLLMIIIVSRGKLVKLLHIKSSYNLVILLYL